MGFNSAFTGLPSALDGVGGQHHAPATLPPGKTRYPLYRRLGGPVWTGAKNLAPTGIRSPDRPAHSAVAIPTALSRPPYSARTQFTSYTILFLHDQF